MKVLAIIVFAFCVFTYDVSMNSGVWVYWVASLVGLN